MPTRYAKSQKESACPLRSMCNAFSCTMMPSATLLASLLTSRQLIRPLRCMQNYRYVVCHFGAGFSACWWQRVGGQILRVTHALLSMRGHKAWLYVDDLFAMLAQATWEQQGIIVTFFLAALHAPISWRKAQLGTQVTWCGWTFHLDIECVQLVAGKLEKLRTQLSKLAQSRKIPRKLLESSLDLLMWATSTCQLLCKDLRSRQGTLHSIQAREWHRFLQCLSNEAVVTSEPSGLWLTPGARLLKIGAIKIQCKRDVPPIPPSQPQWVRLSDPARHETHLRNKSRRALEWLSSFFRHDQLRNMRQSPLLHCMAAANAMAEGDVVGIGGWISTSTQFFWFSETWSMTEVRHFGLC